MFNDNKLFFLYLTILTTIIFYSQIAANVSDPYFFPATKQSVAEDLRPYWNTHGGVSLLGAPVSPAIVLGKGGPIIQYFERAALEFGDYDLNNQPNISSMRIGADVLDFRYPSGIITATVQSIPGSSNHTFTETGKTVSGIFLSYWTSHGSLMQFGYPLTYPFYEISTSNNKGYIVQYFERARFEYHPEANPQNRVMLGLVGREAYQQYLNPKQVPAASSTSTCSYAVNHWFGDTLRYGGELGKKLGCPAEPGTIYDNAEGGGYQQFVNAAVVINTPPTGPAYAYVLYPDQSFRRIDYQGIDTAGGDPPLPSPHFYSVAKAVGNLGPSLSREVWHMNASQRYEHGILFYIQADGSNDVFALLTDNDEAGTWLGAGGQTIPPLGP